MEKSNQVQQDSNLSIYERVRCVPNEAKKEIEAGRLKGKHDINPMWRIKALTEVFGPAGFGWYTEIVRTWTEASESGEMAVFVDINLFVKKDGEWSKPIYGEGGNTFATKTKAGYLSVSDEAFKMAYTDAISNAAKALGCGADIWFEKDRTKYDLQQERAQAAPQPAPAQPAMTDMDIAKLVAQANSCKTADEVMKIYNEHKELWSNEKFSKPIIAIGKAKREQEKGGAA